MDLRNEVGNDRSRDFRSLFSPVLLYKCAFLSKYVYAKEGKPKNNVSEGAQTS